MSPKMITKACYALVSGASMAVVSPAFAEQVNDQFWLQAGIFRPSFDSDAQLSVADSPIEGTDIDFEGDLYLPKRKSVANVEAGARLTDKLRVEAGYFALRRKASHVLEGDILWEDIVYPVATEVTAGFETDIYRLALGYSPLKTDTAELGVRLGAHVTRFNIFIAGDTLDSAPAVQVYKRKRKEMTVPLPHVGLYGNLQLSSVFALHSNANYFQIRLGSKKGSLVDFSAGASARITPNIGIGARYRYVDYDLRIKKSDWHGKVSYSFSGPALYLEAAF